MRPETPATKYAKRFRNPLRPMVWKWIRDAYIAGHRSRDEEVLALRQLVDLRRKPKRTKP